MGDNRGSKNSSRPSLRNAKKGRKSASARPKNTKGAGGDSLDKSASAAQNGNSDVDRNVMHEGGALQANNGSGLNHRYTSRQSYKANRDKQFKIAKKDISPKFQNAASGESIANSKSKVTDLQPNSKQEENLLSSIKHAAFPAHVNQRRIFKENPRIYYMNGESLSRPLFFPRSNMLGLLGIVVVAAIIALAAVFFYFDTTANAPAREREQVEELASKDIAYDLPNLLSFVGMDDQTIDATVKESGATFYDRIPVGQDSEYEVIKLPQDVTLEQAVAMYATGIKNLSAKDAVLLLNGSWVLNVDRTYGVNISLHYADFKSKTVDDAILAAIVNEDLDRGGEGDSGEDDGYGNAYTTGTIMINSENYIWTVSALPLKDYYKIVGLPDNATYVGVRIKTA